MKARKISKSFLLLSLFLLLVGSYFIWERSDSDKVFYGTIHSHMTYGRAVFKNTDESSEFKFFIVEPQDYTEIDADKYSPVITSLESDDVVMVRGKIQDECWWKNGEANTEGCVPWIEAASIER